MGLCCCKSETPKPPKPPEIEPNTTTTVIDITNPPNPPIPIIINEGNNENCIIAVIDIKNDEDIKDKKRIINSYEESQRFFYEKSQNKERVNEDVIK